MKNFAKLLTACGLVVILLSILLLQYNAPGSASYMLCQANIVIGFIMLASGAIYQIVNRNKP